MGIAGYLWFAAGLCVMTLVTILVARGAGLRLGLDPAWVIVRAAAQLSVLALLLRGVLAVPWTVVAFLALMLTTASWTAWRRLDELWHGHQAAVAGVLVGALSAVGLVFALGLLTVQSRYLVAVGGIVSGNAMSAATLAGRNFHRAARTRVDEVEAWLALGAVPARAHQEIGREAAREALLPTLDQTRATGLVTLPGAFVGALFGGASPVDAARFQLVVLAAIALAMTATSVTVTRMLGKAPFIVRQQH